MEFAAESERFPLMSVQDEAVSDDYKDQAIPSFDHLNQNYKQKWEREKIEFQTQLKCNFFALTERFASGKQELFMLAVPERKEKLFINAFLELFQSQYAPHVGDVERLAGKRTRRLFVTLPQCYE